MKVIIPAICALILSVAAAQAPAAPKPGKPAAKSIEADISRHRDMVEKEPENVEAIAGLAQALKRAGKYDEAAIHFSNASKLAPENEAPGYLYELAIVLGWGGRHSEAIGVLEGLKKRFPANRDYGNLLAAVYGWAGKLDEAEAEYRRVLSIAPEDMEAKAGLARTLSWKGEFDRSEKLFREVLAARPQDPSTRLALGNVLLWKGDYEGAIKEAGVVLAKDPENIEARKLRKAAREEKGPSITVSYSSSSDSDSNDLETLKASAYVNIHPLSRLTLGYTSLAASRPGEEAKARIFQITDASRLSERFTLRPSLSLYKLEGSSGETSHAGGGLSADWHPRGRTRAIASFTVAQLVDTATLISNAIRTSEARISLIKDFTRVTLSGSAARTRYSDGNDRDDLSVNIAWKALKEPELILGYVTEYRDFSEKKFNGYFNPSSYMDYVLYATLRGEFLNGRTGYYLTGKAGVADFEGKTESITGVDGGLWWQLTEELNIEGRYKYSRSALESSAGYRFEEYGASLKCLF